ncbi:dTDP-4-dehydrorhamnose 3,5-epimerase [Jannaschia aquimarina]|uniref:dTDP-4-dehydrorhamnose 3,5-epimerase n=1 Tax=Jannaschia aquimarina TaxID=935700 RepID=A0A0D1EF87_9RHOB|nr:dTDP-4-dehydrorhamnose 3,5-epimerase [Jannaschia aquimarina]KIT15551.1 dTDP-4-dehydrorhamnose 3,5-epimerase [Jannaschia aquimarina]SNT26818.1 dTDP-4-dehydrorhamnose 3,5-epimerase [Jannaschia aquimarina]
MRAEETDLPGVVLLHPRRFGDARGFFAETWNARTMSDLGIDAQFVQDNHSLSDRVGTVRGLHFQIPPHAQGKLVRCGRGRLFDVAVDLRRDSPTYGRWTGAELSFENGAMLWIPAGFAHGFVTREPMTEICYKCTDFYTPEAEGAVSWDSCGIAWGLEGEPVLNARDAAAPPLSSFETPFVMAGS